ncbi:type IV pilin protein [Photobacterium iliopiscarium]|uniref:type IV pilin protein n=1 Tax=Photobacterium iliopiscarium TaxID=56192 RepID=UPI0005D43E5D|nr:type IV pilin protein [Photobacterium iliopiscarium]KJG11881.1 fimbrial protein [Photobacterium iliopiscarium]PST96444.1 type IV pilin protein [Photobacterium iliopiscarium]PSV78816.1 type IV pilin protein [Photobacterium iliopiscarium]
MIKQKGVTLIEMLIVVAVIGVLTAIAYPSYQSHVLKGHRTQAMGDLIKIQLALEESYTQDSAYDFTIVSGGSCSFCDTDKDRYVFTITPQTADYIITATAQTKQENDTDCLDKKRLTLNSNSKGSPERCW